jgi:hypothetical protein
LPRGRDKRPARRVRSPETSRTWDDAVPEAAHPGNVQNPVEKF